MALPTNIITKVIKIIRYDITAYLNDYASFINRDRIKIYSYYSGRTSRPNKKAFLNLKALLSTTQDINGLIEIHRNRMNSAQFWEVLELFTQIEESLLTIDNSSKWLRSVITKNNFSPAVEIQTVLKELQTLEQMARELGSSSFESDWVKIALRNDLPEEDYTTDGGNVISTQYYNRLDFNIQSVVDNVDGEKVYGLDIDRQITFEGDDIRVLSYKSTVVQAVGILAGMTMGATPEFPSDGIQVNLVGGSNRMSLPYPVIFRQFYATFQKDDTLKSLLVKDIEYDQDALKISLEVETRFGEVIPTQIAF
jgi:hypothetical protein